jgi:hypothetical protein
VKLQAGSRRLRSAACHQAHQARVPELCVAPLTGLDEVHCGLSFRPFGTVAAAIAVADVAAAAAVSIAAAVAAAAEGVERYALAIAQQAALGTHKDNKAKRVRKTCA